MYYYADGQEIRKGDRICVDWDYRCGMVQGIVKDIFSPGTQDAKDYSCMETGGVFIEEAEPQKAFGLVLEVPENGRLREDYELVSRKI